jgi:hypothetical protein
MRGNYEKYNSILAELIRKIGKTNNIDNMLKYNKDYLSFLEKFNEIIFNFKDEFLEKSLKKTQEEKLRVFSHIEIYNEFEKIKGDLLENIHKDLPKKKGYNYFINRFWNGIFVSNFKDLQYFIFLRNDSLRKKPEDDRSIYKKEHWAVMALNYGIKRGDYKLCYEALGSLKGYENLTGNLEKKLTMIMKRDLFKDLIREHAKI